MMFWTLPLFILISIFISYKLKVELLHVGTSQGYGCKKKYATTSCKQRHVQVMFKHKQGHVQVTSRDKHGHIQVTLKQTLTHLGYIQDQQWVIEL